MCDSDSEMVRRERPKVEETELNLSKELFISVGNNYPGILSPESKRLLTLPEEERSGDAFTHLLTEVEGLKFFEQIPNQTKKILLKKLILVIHQADEFLLRQGEMKDPPQNMYIIASGVVSIRYKAPDSSGTIRSWPEKILRRGECFGHTDILHDRAPSVDAQTVGYSELFLLPKEYFAIARNAMEAHNTRIVQYLRSTEALTRFEWTEEEYKVLEIYSKLGMYAENSEIYSGAKGNKPPWSFFVVAGECKIVRDISFTVLEAPSGSKIFKGVDKESETESNNKVQKKRLQFEGVKQGYYFGVGENFGNNYVIASSTLECLLVPRLLLVFKNKELLKKMADDLTISLPFDQEILDNYSNQVHADEAKRAMFKELFKDKPEKLIGGQKRVDKPRFVKYV